MFLELNYNIEKFTSKSGLPTLNINGYYIHSKYDPIREAVSFVDKNFKPGHVHILFGYGLGYIADALINRFTNDDEKLIVIEPIINNINNPNKKIKIFIESNMDKLKDYLLSSFGIINNITLLCSPNYDKVCPEIYKQFLSVLKNKLSVDRVSENTMIKFSELWQRNYLFNLKHVVNDLSIKKLEKITSSPVVIASGGPSLTKQLPLIKKYREKFVLIASGSTINTLLSDDIIPDFVVSIDGTTRNYEHYKDLVESEITLLYGMYNHYKIKDIFTKNAYYFLTQRNIVLSNHLQSITNEVPVILKGGGSVAHFAFSIAYYITSGPIALVGQDLAYTNNRSHAANNKGFFEFDEEEISKKGLIKVEGYNNEEVLTDYPFLSMKTTFEALIKMYNSNDNIYNCTEGGIKLLGFNQIPFEKFCESFTTEKINKDFINKTNSNNTKKIENLQRLKNQMVEEVNFFDELIDVLDDSLQLILKNRRKDSFEQKILKKLDKNDKKINKLQLKTSLGVILDPINLNVIKRFPPKKNETVEETYKRVYEQNKALYSEYLVAVNNMKKYVVELLEDINNEIEGVKSGNNY